MIARVLVTTGEALRRAVGRAWVQALALASAAAMTLAAETPVTHTILMKATSYAPPELTVKLGDAVVWRNEDPFPHTATAASVFDSKSVAAGASWRYRPTTAGEHAYICTFHPNMKGTLRVE